VTLRAAGGNPAALASATVLFDRTSARLGGLDHSRH